MLAKGIAFSLSNFGLVMLILAMIIALINMRLTKQKHLAPAEIFYRWIALLPLGLTSIYSFMMHAFFGDFTAATIGWQNSPFQYEVAMANLGFGLLGILSFKASYGFRLATVIGNTCWLWGDAIGHIYQMINNSNFAPGNAGSWFWMDLIIPLILIICIVKLRPSAK